MLLPGGTGDYIKIGRQIYHQLIVENDKGNVFPILGICLGFQRLVKFSKSKGLTINSQVAQKQWLTLSFLEDPATTNMFGSMENPNLLAEAPMTYNNHKYGISLENFRKNKGVSSMFRATSTSTSDTTGDTFVASMESHSYPFMGT